MSECNSFAWDSLLEAGAGAGPSASGSASTSKKSRLWPPGIRFHPTDEELIMYHLKRKVCRRRMERNVIGDVDVYKCEPWELPGKSLLQTGDKQWFFFSPRDRKYANGVRSNRGTKCGYWKATGKDRSISRNSRTVGMKKTLVFHKGRAPRGERTDWVMHEYTIVKEELKNYDTVQESYAVYKIFQKSGPGPKNGEQYGAPFREDEWSDDDAFDTGFTIPTSIENVLPPAEPTNGFDQCLSLGSTIPTSRENVLPPAEPTNGFDQCLSLGSTIPTGRENVLPPAVPTNGSDQCLSLDILEEFLLETADNPDLSEQHGGCSFVPKVDGEEGTRNFAVMPLPGEPPGAETSKVWQPCEHADDLQTRIQNTQPANTFLQPPEERCLTDGDFMELNDLLDLKPSVSNLDSRSDEHPFLNKNGAYDWDLYFDAPMFLPEEIVPLEGTSLQPFFGGFSDDVVRQLDYDDENHYVAAQVTSQLWTHEQTINVVSPTGSNRVVLPPSAPGIICDGSLANIHEGTLKEGGSRSDPLDPCFISAIHSLLESVPSNPASASENNLISRALERMSSFGAARTGASSSGIAVDGASPRRRDGRNDGFLFVSCLGALWALMWVLMIGTVVKVFKALFGKFIAS